MHDWFVTVLVSVRDMAAKSGMVALAEEMDIAILVAANEMHEREMADLGKADLSRAELGKADLGKVDVEPHKRAADETPNTAGSGQLRRYH